MQYLKSLLLLALVKFHRNWYIPGNFLKCRIWFWKVYKTILNANSQDCFLHLILNNMFLESRARAYLVENCQKGAHLNLKFFAYYCSYKLDMTWYLNIKNLIGTLKAFEITTKFQWLLTFKPCYASFLKLTINYLSDKFAMNTKSWKITFFIL